MRQSWFVLLTLSLIFGLWSCSGSKFIDPGNAETEASVRIDLKNGQKKEGIIVQGDSKKLVYVDSETHKRENILFRDIKSIQKISKYFDFAGNHIPEPEILSYKKSTKAWLYGAGGLVLGVAVGTGIGIGLYAADQPLLANASILAFGGLGAWWFSKKGHKVDYEEAAFTARKERYIKTKEVRAEKRRLEELKEEKQRLLKELEKKKKKTKEQE